MVYYFHSNTIEVAEKSAEEWRIVVYSREDWAPVECYHVNGTVARDCPRDSALSLLSEFTTYYSVFTSLHKIWSGTYLDLPIVFATLIGLAMTPLREVVDLPLYCIVLELPL